MCAQSLRYLKSKYLSFFSAQWVSRYLGRDCYINHSPHVNKSSICRPAKEVIPELWVIGFSPDYHAQSQQLNICILPLSQTTPILRVQHDSAETEPCQTESDMLL